MRDVDAVERMVRAAEHRVGRIDVLVNNAGIQHVAPVEDFPVEKWDDILAVNLSAAFHTVRLTLPPCGKRGGGDHQHCLRAWPGGFD